MVVTVPTTHTEQLLTAIGGAGGGQIDKIYDYCAFILRGEGRFRPLAGANPTIGTIGRIERVIEDQIEVTVGAERLPRVLEVIRQNHPYEVPVIDVYELVEP